MRFLNRFNISAKVFSGFGIIMPVVDAGSHEQLVRLVHELAAGADADACGPPE